MSASQNSSGTQGHPDLLLRTYAAYRLVLALLLTGMFWLGWADRILDIRYPSLYLATLSGYLSITLVSLLLFKLARYQIRIPALFFTLLVDIFAITLLVHASNGLESGLGLLLITAVAAGSIFANGQLSLLIAAMASIAIMAESAISISEFQQSSRNLMPAGILGIFLFLTAFIFRLLVTRMRAAQTIAETQTSQAEQLQELNESIIKRMHTGIIVVSDDNRIQLINNAAIHLLGGQRLGRPLNVGQTLSIIPPLQQQLESWRVYPWARNPAFEIEHSDAELQANFAELEGGNSRQTLIFLEDNRMFAQHAQQLKLSSLGRLTGSIAHEIRNPLGAISHATQLIQENDTGNQHSRLTGIIRRHSRRVNQIIENVMQLSRQQTPESRKIWLQQWLNNFRKSYLDNESKVGEIAIITPGDDVFISFDLSHLEQVLHNLVDNGLRFSEEKTGRRKVSLVIGTDEETRLPYLDIVDEGPGIADNALEHLFEPFFTTSHEGSGLGLYLAKELCEVNSSLLIYHNNPEGGAVFRIEFPHPDRLLPKAERE